MKLIFAMLMLLMANTLFSQNAASKSRQLDSLGKKLRTDSLHIFRFKKLRPYGNIDNRNSFNKPSNFTGYQLGLIINEYHTFGVGFYRLNQAPKAVATVHQGFRLRSLTYNTIFYEFMLLNRKYLEMDLPIELGFGNYVARITDTTNANFNKSIVPKFFPLSVGVKLIAKPVRWIGFSLMVGYRHLIDENKVLDFNGFNFPVGIWVDLRQVYRDVKYYGIYKKRYRRETKKILE